MTSTIQRDTTCGTKLWLSLYFTHHRQTQPLKTCSHLN